MSEVRERGPRRETVLTRLADLPTPPRRGKGKRRLTPAEEERRKLRDSTRWRREQKSSVTVTWLPEPVMVGRFKICGVTSDASDEVKREYGL